MNRSFRDSPQLQMQAAVMKQRQQLRASMANNNGNGNIGHKEREEEQLALFLEMKRSGIDQNDLLLLLSNADDFDAPLGSKPGTSPIFNISSSAVAPARRVVGDDFINSDTDKNDYDWLLTPPGTPLFPSLEMESQKTIMSQLGTPKARPPSLMSRLAHPQSESMQSSLLSKQSISSPSLSSSGMRRPSSSGGPGSRPSTPTSCPTLSTSAKPSRSSTPTSRATLPSKPTVSTSKPVAPVKPTATAGRFGSASVAKPTVPARSSTPTRTAPRSSSSTVRSSTPTRSAPRSSSPTIRSSTPMRSAPRSSTPTARSYVPPPKSTSMAATPTRRPSTPSSATSASVTPSPSVSKPSSSVSKPSPSVSKSSSAARNPVPSRGTSPTAKSRPWKPSDMPGYSLDAPPNLRTSVPDGSLSAARGRAGVPSSRSSSIEPASNGRPRRQSCSPSRGRTPNGILHSSGSSVPASNRLHAKANDNVSPGLMGTKMVERVVNMRRLIPPRQDDKLSPHGNLSGKSSSPDSSGFGRTLSKKSIDMAIRHMDIRRTIPGNLRPLMTNIPASSMYSVRTGPTRRRTVSLSDSPVATSSNASSEVSVNNNGVYLDGNELENEIGGERGGRSPLRTR